MHPDQPLYGRLLALVLRPTAPPLIAGIVTAAALITVEVVLVSLLKQVAPENAFGAVFLLGVLVVSASWGFGLALATSLASTLAYVWFHVLEGSGSLAPAGLLFLTVALLSNVLVGQARLRALEADQRRREADLAAELARIMLRAADLPAALAAASTRMAEVLEIPYTTLTVEQEHNGDGHQVIALHDGRTAVGSLLVPAELPKSETQRVRRLVPSLEALLSAARDREQISAAVAALAEQQAALRRVATTVADGADPESVYPMAVAELARGLRAEHVTLLRFDADELVVLAAADDRNHLRLQIGERLPRTGDGVSARILATGRPARIDDYSTTTGPAAARVRREGLVSGVGAPITVDGRIWGAILVGSAKQDSLPPETEDRVCDFADLVATAIYNAENRAELKASRARIVAAADQARRGFERDLHDGAQQRIVSLGLELGAMQSSVAADNPELGTQLAGVVAGLSGLYADLQELSRGIHPAILSRGGLGPAFKTLARRSPVAVELSVDIDGKVPDSVEVAAYYVVAEALTNTAKYAGASVITVEASLRDECLRVLITDDGIGGARLGGGSGLVGLTDRVNALAGELVVHSPPGQGTTLDVTIPLTSGQ